MTERYIGKSGLALGYIIGLFVGGTLFLLLGKLLPLERIDEYRKKFKIYPYTEKFSKNYPSPKPEDFAISEAEFKEYNKRFQFENIKFIFTWGLCIAVSIYVIQGKINGSFGIILYGSTILVAILLNYIFECLNKKNSQKHPYYEKIHQYQESLKIYYKIKHENSDL